MIWRKVKKHTYYFIFIVAILMEWYVYKDYCIWKENFEMYNLLDLEVKMILVGIVFIVKICLMWKEWDFDFLRLEWNPIILLQGIYVENKFQFADVDYFGWMVRIACLRDSDAICEIEGWKRILESEVIWEEEVIL